MKMFVKDLNESVHPFMDWRMHIGKKWLQQLPWHHKFYKGIGGNADISKLNFSVKELGQVACQGWLYRKKQGMGFLGSKWKKSWFVLKNTTLYWYPFRTAGKAEGHIHLTDVTIEQAKECKKKYAIKASLGQPPMVILFFATRNVKDLDKWLAKLSAAAKQDPSAKTCDGGNHYGECCIKAKAEEDGESVLNTFPLYSEQLTRDSVSGEIPPPRFTSSPFNTVMAATTPATEMNRESNESQSPRLTGSWLDSPSPEGEWRAPGPPQQWHSGEEEGVAVGGEQAWSSDEMEPVSIHLKQSRISTFYFSATDQLKPTGQTDFGTSFDRHCKNEKIEEKLHLVRILRNTLKSKEADLLAIEQVLLDPRLTALQFRHWKRSNVVLLQEIARFKSPAGGSRVFPLRAAKGPHVAETSV